MLIGVRVWCSPSCSLLRLSLVSLCCRAVAIFCFHVSVGCFHLSFAVVSMLRTLWNSLLPQSFLVFLGGGGRIVGGVNFMQWFWISISLLCLEDEFEASNEIEFVKILVVHTVLSWGCNMKLFESTGQLYERGMGEGATGVGIREEGIDC